MTATRGIGVTLAGVRRRYGGQDVLAGVDLTVAPGELLCIVGQSGQGKSVLLRQIVGLETPDAGTIRLGDLDLATWRALPPERKPFRVAMVFQNAALLASLTVAENVALRLLEQGTLPRARIDAVVRRCLAAVELEGVEDRLPGQLSGGMRKRVAIARALAVEPELILYDEPTADLDPILTEQIGALIAAVRRRGEATQLVVTHNLPLARMLADRIAVLAEGRIVCCVPPAALAEVPHPLVREFLRAAGVGPAAPEDPC